MVSPRKKYILCFMKRKSTTSNLIWLVVVFAIIVGGFFLGRTGTFNNEPSLPSMPTEIQQPDGLDITVLQEGSGETIQNGRVAVVHYTGTLDDGTVFDSSIPRGAPFEFTLGAGQVIAGWDLGILGMQAGEKRQLVIAPELAYGPTARGSIPANSRLTFEVELLEIR